MDFIGIVGSIIAIIVMLGVLYRFGSGLHT